MKKHRQKRSAPAEGRKPKMSPARRQKSTGNNGFRKQYFKSRPFCKVTFRLPKEAAPEADRVTIVGEFNSWDTVSTPMKKLKNGDFTASIELGKDRSYRFRYLINDNIWENDWTADEYLPNSYGCDDSVVIV